jgi:hypothetical protein
MRLQHRPSEESLDICMDTSCTIFLLKTVTIYNSETHAIDIERLAAEGDGSEKIASSERSSPQRNEDKK